MDRLDRLLGVLRRRGLLRGEEIQRELGISKPAMSRLMRAAGSRVCRFGRSVGTRYALPREITGLGRHSPVFRVDERGHANRHGVLHFLAGGGSWLERWSYQLAVKLLARHLKAQFFGSVFRFSFSW